MYAMDTAVHLEHRNETRRSRWDLRRTPRTTTSPGAAQSPTPGATADNPVHDFID